LHPGKLDFEQIKYVSEMFDENKLDKNIFGPITKKEVLLVLQIDKNINVLEKLIDETSIHFCKNREQSSSKVAMDALYVNRLIPIIWKLCKFSHKLFLCGKNPEINTVISLISMFDKLFNQKIEILMYRFNYVSNR
jgi:hypothetical protein